MRAEANQKLLDLVHEGEVAARQKLLESPTQIVTQATFADLRRRIRRGVNVEEVGRLAEKLAGVVSSISTPSDEANSMVGEVEHEVRKELRLLFGDMIH